jgi:hypothetical protein
VRVWRRACTKDRGAPLLRRSKDEGSPWMLEHGSLSEGAFAYERAHQALRRGTFVRGHTSRGGRTKH